MVKNLFYFMIPGQKATTNGFTILGSRNRPSTILHWRGAAGGSGENLRAKRYRGRVSE